MGVAEHREHRHAAHLIDGVVAPVAGRDPTAVEREQLVEFVSGEENRAGPPAVVAESNDRAHLAPAIRLPLVRRAIAIVFLKTRPPSSPQADMPASRYARRPIYWGPFNCS